MGSPARRSPSTRCSLKTLWTMLSGISVDSLVEGSLAKARGRFHRFDDCGRRTDPRVAQLQRRVAPFFGESDPRPRAIRQPIRDTWPGCPLSTRDLRLWLDELFQPDRR